MEKLLLNTILCLCFLWAGSATKAVAETPDLTNYKEAFTISCFKTAWDKAGNKPITNTSVYEILTSIAQYGGSTWDFENAVYANYNHLMIGDQLFEGISKLHNQNAISSAISAVSIYVEVPSKADLSRLNEIRLLVSSDNDFSNPAIIKTTDQINNGTYLNFYINDPQPNRYYQLEFDAGYAANTSRLLSINSVTFYSEPVPVFELNVNDTEKFCSVTSESGPLHLIATEYNADGSVYKDIVAPKVQNAPARTVALDDTSWTNMVANEGEAFKVNLPEDKSHFVHIRAKSQKSDGTFTNEISKIYTGEGIETSTSPTITSDTVSEPVYYDLYGNRLDSPVPGICIKVEGGKTTKLLIR